jgi:hypothetical protein
MPVSEVLNRKSLQHRICQVESELQSLEGRGTREPARAIVRFRGDPVVGTHGIFAKFGAMAMGQFTETVKALAAKIVGAIVRATGPIPGCGNNELLITGTAPGSFGFIIEENLENIECVAQDDGSVLQKAMHKAVRILRSSTDSDQVFVDEIDDIDDRIIDDFHDFLKTLSDNKAYCSLEVDGEHFTFKNEEQVSRSMNRFIKSNIIENEEEFEGKFSGSLLHARSFEFELSQEHVIRGTIDNDNIDPDDIIANCHKRARITVKTRKVGEAKTTYKLVSYTFDK